MASQDTSPIDVIKELFELKSTRKIGIAVIVIIAIPFIIPREFKMIAISSYITALTLMLLIKRLHSYIYNILIFTSTGRLILDASLSFGALLLMSGSDSFQSKMTSIMAAVLITIMIEDAYKSGVGKHTPIQTPKWIASVKKAFS